MFEIENTLSFNKEVLTKGTTYDYVTRTSQNQGILQETGFVNSENINSVGTWSLGLLQMDFFYRDKPWYAGQFVRKITPKIKLDNKKVILFFTVLLNKHKSKLLSVLVRDVDDTFRNSKITLPTKDGAIDFAFMETFIAELEAQHIAELEAQRITELEAYLTVTGLKDYTLTEEEGKVLNSLDKVQWKEYKIVDIFNVKNTNNILSAWITPDSGEIPYLSASQSNNSVASYIEYNRDMIDKGNSIFIGGKTLVISYQEQDYFSNDSHNLALYIKDGKAVEKKKQLFMVACLYKSLKPLYTWGNSISNKKIQKDIVMLPTKNGTPDYDFMNTYIKAIEKLVIKEVVLYAEKKIQATQEVVNNSSNP